MWTYLGIGALCIVAFLIWRVTSVGRGAARRDRRIEQELDPVAQKLFRSEDVAPDEVAAFAQRPELRPHLYSLLKHHERLELFPSDLRVPAAQACGLLAYWMMHPNELGDAPESIEVEREFERSIDQRPAHFFVLAYRMPPGHWAGQDPLLGIAGPFFDGDPPYDGVAGAFARSGDKLGETDPEELVDWFVELGSSRSSSID